MPLRALFLVLYTFLRNVNKCLSFNTISLNIFDRVNLLLLRNRLRLNDVTLPMSSLLVVLRDLSAWFSIFDTAHLTDLGSKTGYRRLTSSKMSNKLLIIPPANCVCARSF